MIDYSTLRYCNGGLILNKQEINTITSKCLAEFDREVLRTPMPIMVEEIAELMLGYTLRYEHLSHNQAILAAIAFNAGRVTVYDDVKDDIKYIDVEDKTILLDRLLLSEEQRGRHEFSIGHEIGHAVIHPPSLIDYGDNNMIMCANTTGEFANTAPNRARSTKIEWREWQADYFASCLKLPKATVLPFAREYLVKHLGHSSEAIKVIGIEEYDIAEKLWSEVADFFITSKTAARIRLQDLQIIRELTKSRYNEIQSKKNKIALEALFGGDS